MNEEEINELEERALELKRKIDKLQNMVHLLEDYDNLLSEIEKLKYDGNYNDFSFECAYNKAVDDVLELIDEYKKFVL